jgi:hypothetical protein
MAHRITALLGLLVAAACSGGPRAPDNAPEIALTPLPSGGCYDAPLAMDVNGARHALTRTGPRSFVASGPIFSALEMDIATDGEAVYVQTRRGPAALEGDPDGCRLSGRGTLRSPTRGIPLNIAIAPAV